MVMVMIGATHLSHLAHLAQALLGCSFDCWLWYAFHLPGLFQTFSNSAAPGWWQGEMTDKQEVPTKEVQMLRSVFPRSKDQGTCSVFIWTWQDVDLFFIIFHTEQYHIYQDVCCVVPFFERFVESNRRKTPCRGRKLRRWKATCGRRFLHPNQRIGRIL